MPYAACDYCERVFIPSEDVKVPNSCPTCRRPLRTLTDAEGRSYFLQIPDRRPAAGAPVPAPNAERAGSER